jgi:hypothetical protein
MSLFVVFIIYHGCLTVFSKTCNRVDEIEMLWNGLGMTSMGWKARFLKSEEYILKSTTPL